MVGSVNTNAHVDAVGYTLVALNSIVGLCVNPSGGSFAAPLKNTIMSSSEISSSVLASECQKVTKIINGQCYKYLQLHLAALKIAYMQPLQCPYLHQRTALDQTVLLHSL